MKTDLKRTVEIVANIALTAAAITVMWTIFQSQTSERSPAGRAGRAISLSQADTERLDSILHSVGAETPSDIVIFVDVECPFCARYSATLDSVRLAMPEVKITYLQYPLPQHRAAMPGALALECSRSSGRLPELLSLAYSRQATLPDDNWSELATSAGVSASLPMSQCMQDPSTISRVQSQVQLARDIGVTGTPGVVVRNQVFAGPPNKQELLDALRN